jgi:hypothetical protein
LRCAPCIWGVMPRKRVAPKPELRTNVPLSAVMAKMPGSQKENPPSLAAGWALVILFSNSSRPMSDLLNRDILHFGLLIFRQLQLEGER